MTTPSGWIRPTFWPITRRSHAKSHQGCVVRAMPALSSTITRTSGAVPRNTNTGTLISIQIQINFLIYDLFKGRLHVLTSSRVMNGVTLSVVKPAMPVSTAIRAPSNNFIPKSTSQPNVTTFKTPATVLAGPSAPLPTSSRRPSASTVRPTRTATAWAKSYQRCCRRTVPTASAVAVQTMSRVVSVALPTGTMSTMAWTCLLNKTELLVRNSGMAQLR